MTNQHPITPPENLIHKWEGEWHHHRGRDTYEEFMAKQAAQWGADQELEACCEWLEERNSFTLAEAICNDRRPKPPSLREQALAEVAGAVAGGNITPEQGAIIRVALEALPND
jgi:hypothetical protein